jgi:hypothetical protein
MWMAVAQPGCAVVWGDTWCLRSGIPELGMDSVLPHAREGGSVRVDHPSESRPNQTSRHEKSPLLRVLC